MIDELSKQIILSDMSKLNTVSFNNVANDFTLMCSVGLQAIYDILYVECSNADNLQVSVNGIVVFSATDSICKLIPIFISKTAEIKISGKCKFLSLSLFNGKFLYDKQNYVLPLKDMYISFCGESINVMSYSTSQDFINNSLLQLSVYNNVLDMQTVVLNGVYTNVMVKYDKDTYICLEMDNYTDMVKVADGCVDAVVVPCKDGSFFVIYEDNGLKCKKYVDGEFVDGVGIEIKNTNKYCQLVHSTYLSIDLPIFVVKFDNGNYGIYALKDNQFVLILSIKCEQLKVYQVDSYIYVCVLGGCRCNIKKYSLNLIDNNILCELLVVKKVDNIDDVYLISDEMIVSNKGNYTKIDKF